MRSWVFLGSVIQGQGDTAPLYRPSERLQRPIQWFHAASGVERPLNVQTRVGGAKCQGTCWIQPGKEVFPRYSTNEALELDCTRQKTSLMRQKNKRHSQDARECACAFPGPFAPAGWLPVVHSCGDEKRCLGVGQSLCWTLNRRRRQESEVCCPSPCLPSSGCAQDGGKTWTRAHGARDWGAVVARDPDSSTRWAAPRTL